MPIPEFLDNGWLPEGHYPVSWDELTDLFSGEQNSLRRNSFNTLVYFRDSVRELGITGKLYVDGSFISSAPEPHDVDILLIAGPEIQALKDANPKLSRLLDPCYSEENGYSILYAPATILDIEADADSLIVTDVVSVWDRHEDGFHKGVLEVEL